MFLISNFHRVLNVVCFLLGNSTASEFYMSTFRNTLSVTSSYLPDYGDGTECSETSEYNIRTLGNYPEESIQNMLQECVFFLGLVTVPAGGGGTFLGGYLVKRLNLHCAGIIRFCVIATLVGVTFTTCFFLSCPNLAFAGVTQPYGNSR